jgi:hypothetical protein
MLGVKAVGKAVDAVLRNKSRFGFTIVMSWSLACLTQLPLLPLLHLQPRDRQT